MQLLAVIVPPPEVVRDALEAAQALCSTEPATEDEGGRGLLDRIRGRRGGASRTAPSVALHPLSSDAVFVRLAKFGNVTGDDVEGLARALTAVAGTWPAPVLRTTGVSVTESEPHTVTAQLGGDVDALRDIYGNVNEVARQQRFFLDRRSFRSELVVGSVEGQDGAPVPPTLLGAEAPHAGPSWSPAHVTLVRASFGASGATYSELAQVELAPGRRGAQRRQRRLIRRTCATSGPRCRSRLGAPVIVVTTPERKNAHDAETVEQTSGFCPRHGDDDEALVVAAQVLTRAHPVVEIRPVADD